MAAPERFVNFDIGQPQALRDAVNSVFGASGANHAAGLVPDPGSTPGTSRFLREDGQFIVIVGLSAIGNDTVLGNISGGSATPVALTQAQLTTLINTFTSALSGAVPASGGGTTTFLRADGAFAAPPNNVTLLNTLTASNSASLQDTSSLTATYSNYMIVMRNLVPATGSQNFQLQAHSGGSFQGTTYAGGTFRGNSGGTGFVANSGSVLISASNIITTSAPGLSGIIYVSNPSQTATPKTFFGEAFDTTPQISVFGGYWNGGNGAVDGFQLSFASGNITSGTVQVYGIS